MAFTFERPTGKSKQVSNKRWKLPNCTEHQIDVVSKMLNSDADIVQLNGAAGVGKSHTLAALVSYMVQHKTPIALTGTTHAAVANVRAMLPKDHAAHVFVGTIHSYLGLRIIADGKGGEDLKPIPNFKEPTEVDYLFIDESSMVTSQLITSLSRVVVKKKVILVGDAIQLTLPNSCALDRYASFELTVNMRQGINCPDMTEMLLDLRERILLLRQRQLIS